MEKKPFAVPSIAKVTQNIANRDDKQARAWVSKFTALLKAQTGLSVAEAGYSEAELLNYGYENADPAALIEKLVANGKAIYIQGRSFSSVVGKMVRNAF